MDGGGLFSGLASLGARLGSTATRFVRPTVTAVARPAATAAASTASRAATAAAAAKATSTLAATAAPASLLSRIGSRVMPVANLAALGLGIGLPVYQLTQMRQQEAQDARDRADAAAAQAKADKEAAAAQKVADAQFADNQKAIDAAIAAANAQKREAELMAAALEEQRKKEADAYSLYISQQDAANKAALEQYTADQLMLLYTQYGSPAAPTAPAAPSAPSAPSAPAAPSAPMTTFTPSAPTFSPPAAPAAPRKPTKKPRRGGAKGASAIEKMLDAHMRGGLSMRIPDYEMDPFVKQPRMIKGVDFGSRPDVEVLGRYQPLPLQEVLPRGYAPEPPPFEYTMDKEAQIVRRYIEPQIDYRTLPTPVPSARPTAAPRVNKVVRRVRRGGASAIDKMLSSHMKGGSKIGFRSPELYGSPFTASSMTRGPVGFTPSAELNEQLKQEAAIRAMVAEQQKEMEDAFRAEKRAQIPLHSYPGSSHILPLPTEIDPVYDIQKTSPRRTPLPPPIPSRPAPAPKAKKVVRRGRRGGASAIDKLLSQYM